MNGRARAARHLLRLRRRYGAPGAPHEALVPCTGGAVLFFPRLLPAGWPQRRGATPVVTRRDGWSGAFSVSTGGHEYWWRPPHFHWPAPNPWGLVRVVQTCAGAPSQWDAWMPDGTQLYLRYRHGRGRVELGDGTRQGYVTTIMEWDEHDPHSSVISLPDFLSMTPLTLAPGAQVVPYENPEDPEEWPGVLPLRRPPYQPVLRPAERDAVRGANGVF